MKVRVVFYGVLKQDVGAKEQVIEFPQESLTIAELVETLQLRYPALVPRLGTVAYVVQDEIVASDHLLVDGDEAGVLPPVSGG
jgi:molybdopterin converting factor small subunit